MHYDCLIVDDETAIASSTSEYFNLFELSSAYVTSYEQCIRFLKENTVSLLLLDINLGGRSGFSLCKKLREQTDIPILFISARTSDDDILTALNIGGDDYITKPFGTSELLARIRTSLRHSNRLYTTDSLYIRPYRYEDLVLDFSKRELTLNKKPVHLTPIEYKIVSYLAQNSGKVMTYAAIISNVWGPYADDDNKILRVNMANIRRKLEKDPAQPKYIFTEVGVGYRMQEDSSEND